MIGLIAGIVIFILIAAVLFFVLKKILKVVLILIGILFITFIVCGYFVYKDAKDMQQNFESSPNIILLESDGNIIAGIQTAAEEEPTPLDTGEIADYNGYYKSDELDKIKGDSYKLIIFKEEAFDSVESVSIENKSYTREFIFVLIKSATPVDDYIDYSLIQEGVPQEQREQQKQQMKSDFELTDTEFKGMLLASLFSDRQEDEGPLFLFKQFKKGNAVIYKETAVFKLVSYVPTAFVGNLVQNATTAVKEKVSEKIEQVS